MGAASGVDETEVERFNRLGAQWWDEQGPMRPLHQINPLRVGWIRDNLVATMPHADGTARQARQAAPLAGLSILDIGCGAGLLCEPLARLGARMTGIDPAPHNITIAQEHARAGGLAIDYQQGVADDLAAKGALFDVVLAMEVIEHVPDPAAFTRHCLGLLRPGGLFFGATLNRTLRSFALAIVGAEYVLRWLPRGTHEWHRFITPDEFEAFVERAGARPLARSGLVFNPLRNAWRLSDDMAVNYMIVARQMGAAAAPES